jgi:hypothetical protein
VGKIVVAMQATVEQGYPASSNASQGPTTVHREKVHREKVHREKVRREKVSQGKGEGKGVRNLYRGKRCQEPFSGNRETGKGVRNLFRGTARPVGKVAHDGAFLPPGSPFPRFPERNSYPCEAVPSVTIHVLGSDLERKGVRNHFERKGGREKVSERKGVRNHFVRRKSVRNHFARLSLSALP